MDNHCTKTELLSYLTGSISDDTSTRITAHLTECSSCASQLEKLKEAQEQFLESMPFDENMFEEKPETKVTQFPKLISTIAALLIVAVTVIYFNPNQRSEHFTMKSAASMTILVEDPSGEIVERDSHIYYPNERIQICYTASDTAYLMLVSLDSAGTVSRYCPSHGNRLLKVEPGARVPLPNSVRLDHYIGEETLVLILADNDMAVDEMEQRITEAFSTQSLEQLEIQGSVIVQTISKQVVDE